MFDTVLAQGSLFGIAAVDFDRTFSTMRRVDLGEGAWLDYAPMWLTGHEAVYQRLVEAADWRQPVVQMYDRQVVTPRLVARLEPDVHDAVPSIIDTLSERYGMRLDQVSAGWYRNGEDSVAPHGDRVARDRPRAIVATSSLGGARRFLIKSKSGRASHAFSLGHGDLVVMGGSSQRTHEHGVPKTSGYVEPRIALMFRHLHD